MSSRPWTDFTGRALYLDTMIFYTFLRTEVAKTLFTRIEMGSLEAYTSVLTFDELTYKLLLALIHDNYPGSPLEHLRNQEEAMIAEFYPRLAPLLGQLLAYPHLTFVDVTPSDIIRMNENISRYYLRPRDALHLAAMQACGCFALVSHDADLDRVPGIQRYHLSG
ncbi:MAG: type II toxin-antitoxin system VapC family toxin [Anaerolineae bacterium]